MKKQCLLLTSDLRTPITTVVVQQCIKEMAGGTSPHCYDALGLTFANAVNAVKNERQKIADEWKVGELRPKHKEKGRSKRTEVSVVDANAGETCNRCWDFLECSTCSP